MWTKGETRIEGTEVLFWIKHFEEPSEDYGIDGGPRPHGRGGFKAAVPLVHPWFVVGSSRGSLAVRSH